MIHLKIYFRKKKIEIDRLILSFFCAPKPNLSGQFIDKLNSVTTFPAHHTDLIQRVSVL